MLSGGGGGGGAAAAADYELREATIVRGATSVTQYSAVFTSAAWSGGPGFRVAPGHESAYIPALVRRAYAAALSKSSAGDRTDVPRHVHLCVSTRVVRGAKPRLVVANLPPTTTAQWVFILEVIPETCTVVCVGGLARAKFERLAFRRGEVRTIARVQCDPGAFCDVDTLTRETSLPAIPSALESPHASVMSASSSGMERDALLLPQSPLLDYAAVEAVATRELVASVAAVVPLAELLRERYRGMSNAALYLRGIADGKTPAQVAARGPEAGATQLAGAATVATLECARDADVAMQHTVHVVAHYLVRKYILATLPADKPAWAWFATQEAQLVELHLRFAAPDTMPTPALVALLAPAAAHFGMRFDAAVDCYTVDAIDALVMGIAALSDGARDVYIDPATHLLRLSAVQVARDVLPIFIAACIRGDVRADGIVADGANDDDDALYSAGAAIVDERAARTTGATDGLYLPRRNVDPQTLPHLGNPTLAVLLPLCSQRLRRKLYRTGHLQFGERYEYVNLLLDLGYTKGAVEAHVESVFTAKGAAFRKYASLANRSEKDKWEDDVRTIPYGMSCGRKADARDLPGDVDPTNPDMCIGCPYARLDSKTLAAEVRISADDTGGLADIEEIVRVAGTGDAQGACAEHFRQVFPTALPPRHWRPRATRTFVHPALDRIQAALRAAHADV